MHNKFHLRGWRKYRGLTQEQLAERMDVDRTIISKLENGKIDYTQGHLEAAANALSCTEADLLVRDPSEPENVFSIWDRIAATERPAAIKMLKSLVNDDAAKKAG